MSTRDKVFLLHKSKEDYIHKVWRESDISAVQIQLKPSYESKIKPDTKRRNNTKYAIRRKGKDATIIEIVKAKSNLRYFATIINVYIYALHSRLMKASLELLDVLHKDLNAKIKKEREKNPLF